MTKYSVGGESEVNMTDPAQKCSSNMGYASDEILRAVLLAVGYDSW